MPINPWHTNSFFDSCAFNPHSPEHEASNEILRLRDEEDLVVLIPDSVREEVKHPKTPHSVKAKASGLIYTIKGPGTRDEECRYQKILDILTGQGVPKNMEDDARHIFHAQKYGGAYFITTDNRLLKRAGPILRYCNLCILLPSQFLERVRSAKRRQ